MHDHFQYSLFGLNMLPMQFCTILGWQPFSSILSRTLISSLSRERSFYKCRARPLPAIVIWPKYATRVILRDSETATFFARVQSRMLISQPSREHSFHKFRARLLPIIVIWCKCATCAISLDSETATFFVLHIAHANIPAVPGALIL